MNALGRLRQLGQSAWYDNLRRADLDDGSLARMILNDSITGVTSNPTIFEKAIADGPEYEGQLLELVGDGVSRTDEQVMWELVLRDVGRAARQLRDVHDSSAGADGFVSIEVSPELAHETDATVAQALWLRGVVAEPNVMVKVPATAAGVPAVEELVASGCNVNVTLIFGLERYGEVIDAYLRGIERLAAAGGELGRVSSVASFFVSRVDTEVDRRLADGHPLRGKAAVANARLAYALFRERFQGDRWEHLAEQGARLQRPLWASTSTKNPAYRSTLYVDTLVGSDSVNTLAPPSVEALRTLDPAVLAPDSIAQDLDDARSLPSALAEAGVDLAEVTSLLEEEGVAAFTASHRSLLGTLARRRADLVGAAR